MTLTNETTWKTSGWQAHQIVCDEIVEFAAECLARRMFKSQIKKYIYEIIGGTCNRATIETVLRRARLLLQEQAGVNMPEEKADAIGFLKTVIADETVAVRDKLAAQDQLNKILGLGPYGQTTGDDDLARARKIKEHLLAMNTQTDAQAPQ